MYTEGVGQNGSFFNWRRRGGIRGYIDDQENGKRVGEYMMMTIHINLHMNVTSELNTGL